MAEAGAAVARRLESLPAVAGARRVAAYRAVRGEIPLDALLEGERREVFTLPRVVGEDLEFVAWCEGQAFARGSFGIPEPADGEVVAFTDHDAVLLPLTAFDGRGHRLGQGGGSTTGPWRRCPPVPAPAVRWPSAWPTRSSRSTASPRTPGTCLSTRSPPMPAS